MKNEKKPERRRTQRTMFKPCEYLVEAMVWGLLSSNSDNDDVWVWVEDLFELAKVTDDSEDAIRGSAKSEEIVDMVEMDQSGAVFSK